MKKMTNKSLDFSETLLGVLITNFRNKKHIFLNTMKMCHQGDQNIVFSMAKYVSGKMSHEADLNKIMQLYPIWREFMHVDLKKY